jgi:uncharacterized surface protein with fasciclin (FAS1) repeats
MKTNSISIQLKQPILMVRAAMFIFLMTFASLMAFAQSTVVEVIVGSPDHQTLEAAVVAAELADDLSGEGPFTVFAPTDAAFSALPEGTVESLLEDPTGQLADILLYHVVASSAKSTDLSDGQMITTLNGDKIKISFTDGKVLVDNATVTVADITTDNGVVHVIDAVILPAQDMAKKGGCQTQALSSSN